MNTLSPLLPKASTWKFCSMTTTPLLPPCSTPLLPLCLLFQPTDTMHPIPSPGSFWFHVCPNRDNHISANSRRHCMTGFVHLCSRAARKPCRDGITSAEIQPPRGSSVLLGQALTYHEPVPLLSPPVAVPNL